MPVKTHQVSYFLALCEEQSFTRAARRCGIAQPSLTRAIQSLESEFGGLLFERKVAEIRGHGPN
jgi:LysR family hydrogen peroxide-inducible transcriptional activator